MNTTYAESDIDQVAADLVHSWQAATTPNSATGIGLSGDLGAGKTTLVQAIARQLGIADTVTSPTYVIATFYDIDQEDLPWKRLVHADAYRLEEKADLEKLGLGDWLSDPQNLVIIEWPEQVGIDGELQTMKIMITDQQKRQITTGE